MRSAGFKKMLCRECGAVFVGERFRMFMGNQISYYVRCPYCKLINTEETDQDERPPALPPLGVSVAETISTDDKVK